MKKVIFSAAVAAIVSAGAAIAATPSNQLVIGAQNKLDTYGFNVDAGSLTESQLAGIHFVDDTSDASNVDVRSRILTVLNQM